MPDFSTLPTGWVTDRYEPASFSNVGTYQGRDNVLGIAIDSSTDQSNRGSQSSLFYSTQGRKYAFSPLPGPGSTLSAHLYIPASWANEANGAVRTDIWATMEDASSAISAYPIIGFTNYNGGGRLRVWDGAGWVDLTTPILYNSWVRFSMQLNPDTSLSYFVNGDLVFTDTDTGSSAAFREVIMQAYNFAHTDIIPPAASTAPYTAYWSNATDDWIKWVDDDGTVGPNGCDDTGDVAATSVAAAVTAADPGDTIRVCPGTYPTASTIALNKAGLTIIGAEATKPVLQIAHPQGYIFTATAAGITLDNLEIEKTDLGSPHNLILINGNDFTAQNMLMYGPDPGGTWNSTGLTSRAFEAAGGRTGLNINNNVIHTLRQPGYMNASSGQITNNNVSGTKGWVIDGAGAIYDFQGNTWGEPQNQDCDIALLSSVNPANYPSRLAMSAANDNAFICAQYAGGENGRGVVYVDSSASMNGSDNTPYATIQAGIDGALAGGEVVVAAGTYVEDVHINKTLTLTGAGAGSTTISGPIGGQGSTVSITGSNATVRGFTITREGNNPTDWNDGGLNFAGIAIQGLAVTNASIYDNTLTGNRTAIDINNSNGHTIRNNVIEANHTGLIFRNQTDNMTFVENAVVNNRTVGILFLDASGGSNSPVQQALGSTFSNNNISGNWYGEIVDRQAGGSLPTPGTTNLKYFQGNWLGSTTPVVTTADSGEPGYPTHIPVEYGGTATDPGGEPDIAGPGSENFRYTPLLTSGTDTDVETVAGRGTYGFQGTPVVVNSTSADGWVFFEEIATGSGGFVGGPPTAPLGTGSANLTVDATGRMLMGTANYAGTRLDSITHLRYRSHQVSSNAAVAPSLQIDMDYDDTDANTGWQGRLVYEPYMSGTVQQNTWQTWDPLAGNWWASGAPGNTVCPQGDPCTWSEVLAAFPNAAIRPVANGGALIFKAGGPVGDTMVSHVDGFEIGVNTANTVHDFEPARPTVTVEQAVGQNDPTSDLTINFTATFSEDVTGFDSSDVVIGGTAGATTAVVTGGPSVYNIAVSGMTDSGTVTASVVDSAAVNGVNAPSQASTSTDNSVTYFTCNTVSVASNIPTLRNQQVVVPITVDDVSGRSIISYDTTVNYDPAVLSYVGIESTGTISNGMSFTINSLTPGVLGISAYGTSELAGSGTLLNLRFMAVGAIGSTSDINFAGFAFNEGVPCVSTVNGSVEVISSEISGNVNYVNAPATTPVPGVTLSGSGSVPVSTVSDANGNYVLDGFGPGAYTVTPSKSGDVNGIAALDASRVSQHVVGLITLNSTQLMAADVSGNGSVTSFDAAQISQWIVLIPNASSTGTWRFIPTSRNYSGVETAQANQNYDAILMGEVTGNWAPPAPFGMALPSDQLWQSEIGLEVGEINAEAEFGVNIPVAVKGAVGKEIIAYQFDVRYDPAVLEPIDSGATVLGTVSSDLMAVSNSPEPGLLKVVVYGAYSINNDGTLLNLLFNTVGKPGMTSKIEITNVVVNDGSILPVIKTGGVTIVEAGDADLSGTVRSAEDKPVAGAIVILRGLDGAIRLTASNERGDYRFEGLDPKNGYEATAVANGLVFGKWTVSGGHLDMIADR